MLQTDLSLIEGSVAPLALYMYIYSAINTAEGKQIIIIFFYYYYHYLKGGWDNFWWQI